VARTDYRDTLLSLVRPEPPSPSSSAFADLEPLNREVRRRRGEDDLKGSSASGLTGVSICGGGYCGAPKHHLGAGPKTRPAQKLALPLFVLTLAGVVFNDAQVLRCPNCRKRIKLGADTCHHCGRKVAAS
jgi:hypothetical protein